MGLTRRGKGTTVMGVADGHGLPLASLVAGAQQAEVHLAEATLDRVRVPRAGRGRPKQRPRELVADKGYDSRALRMALRRRGIRACIPRLRNRRPRPGRRPDLTGYRSRWVVERTFAWLGALRRLLVRHERLASVSQGFLTLACALLALRRVLQ